MTAADIDPNAPAEFEEGRTFPFATVGDYVALADVSDRACRVYWLLRMHVNHERERERGDSTAWPAQPTLADIIGVKKTDTISAAIRELVKLGAVGVKVITTPTGRRNRYTVHLAPPRKYDGHTCLDDYYEERKARRSEGVTPKNGAPPAGSETRRSEGVSPKNGAPGVPPENGGRVPPENGGRVPPENGGRVPPENGVEPQEVEPQESNHGSVPQPPSAPHPPDGAENPGGENPSGSFAGDGGPVVEAELVDDPAAAAGIEVRPLYDSPQRRRAERWNRTARSSEAQEVVEAWASGCTRRPFREVLNEVAGKVESLLRQGASREHIAAGLTDWEQAGMRAASQLPRFVHRAANRPASQAPDGRRRSLGERASAETKTNLASFWEEQERAEAAARPAIEGGSSA